MKLGIGGLIALALGVWVLVKWWWLVAEIITALVGLGLAAGGALAIAIATRKMYRAKTAGK
ncbi:MAG: hypothetical protein ACYSTL_00110 [Planctomycetota bacterium]